MAAVARVAYVVLVVDNRSLLRARKHVALTPRHTQAEVNTNFIYSGTRISYLKVSSASGPECSLDIARSVGRKVVVALAAPFRRHGGSGSERGRKNGRFCRHLGNL